MTYRSVEGEEIVMPFFITMIKVEETAKARNI